MEIADLARWTPVHVDFSGPTPTMAWADLSHERFLEPFFDETAARWAAGPRAAPLVRTDLAALAALDTEPSLEPDGMIFHLSRCGSTLVSRLLSTLDGVVVLAEPSPLNALLSLDPARVDRAVQVQLVRLMVRALGRCRHGDERQLVLKCTSWNIRHREILASAFPDTPWVWVQRDPVEVVSSLMAEPPGWLRLHSWPQRARQQFGLDPALVPAMTREEFAANVLAALLDAAAADPTGRLCVDHADLPAAVWQQVAPHFGLHMSASAIETMAEQSRFYSKSAVPQLFSGDDEARKTVSAAMREAAERCAGHGYRRLASHR